MADFTLKAHDRLPSIQAALTQNGTAVDLTTAVSVKFIMVNSGTSVVKVNAAATIVSLAGGTVRYDWGATDTDTVGTYTAEWEVTWTGTKKQTFPTLSYHSIAILADLDNA